CRLSFSILGRVGTTDRLLVAQVIQAELKTIGVEVAFETLDNASFIARWRRGEWEAVVSAWFFPVDSTLIGLYVCDGSNNATGFCDPALDEFFVFSDHELRSEGRKRLFGAATMRMFESARTLFLYHNVISELVGPRIVNY